VKTKHKGFRFWTNMYSYWPCSVWN